MSLIFLSFLLAHASSASASSSSGGSLNGFLTSSDSYLTLGFSHPIKYTLPEGIKAKVDANTKIVLESSNKQLLGQVSAEIQKFRPPEPYKGKGILFEGEKIKRKAGKSGNT